MKSTGRFTPALRKLVHYHHDTCSKCGAKFPKSVPAYAGYAQDKEELYVGNCCKGNLDELASYIYWWWLSYKRPKVDTPLLRFMDFSKLVAMLSDRAIYFARADTLGDPFEGARGIVARRDEWKDYTMKYYRNLIANPPAPYKNTKSDAEIEAEALKLYQDIEEISAREITEQYVNCWHSSDVESEALWRLYCPPPAPGVCIKTTFGALDQALKSEEEIRFGHVQYIDFKKHFARTYDRIFWKRKSLSHEAEVRAVIHPGSDSYEEKGLRVPANLDAFIEAIIVSPFSPQWFDNVLKQTLERFGVNVPVIASEVSMRPFY